MYVDSITLAIYYDEFYANLTLKVKIYQNVFNRHLHGATCSSKNDKQM